MFTTMASLIDLPAEIILDILEYLCSNADPAYRAHSLTFFTIARSCRKLAPLALPFLYARYEADFSFPIAGFVRQLQQAPGRYQDIKHIKISHSPPVVYPVTTAPGHISNESSEHEPRFGYRLDKGLRGPSHHILLAKATNVQTLHFSPGCSNEQATKSANRNIGFIFRHIMLAAQSLHQSTVKTGLFCRLHTLDLDFGRHSVAGIDYIFTLPALTSLRLKRIVDPKNAITTRHIPSLNRTSRITTFQMADCDLACAAIAQMIGYCRALTKFEWIDNMMNGYDCVMCSKVTRALEAHRDTLKHIYILPCQLSVDQHHSALHETRVQGFQRFHQLETLRAPFMTIVGFPSGPYSEDIPNLPWHCKDLAPLRSVLPPKLQSLTMDLGDWTLPEGIEEYLVRARPQAGEQVVLRKLDTPFYKLGWEFFLTVDFSAVSEAYEACEIEYSYSICIQLDGKRTVLCSYR
jgi:hypothetical protein